MLIFCFVSNAKLTQHSDKLCRIILHEMVSFNIKKGAELKPIS